MAYLNDQQIRNLCTQEAMVFPFSEKSDRLESGEYCPSYGLSSYGYDVRLGSRFYVSVPGEKENPNDIVVETILSPDKKHAPLLGPYLEVEGSLILGPKEFCLGHTLEKFKMPKNVMGVCMGKSTLARMGILVVVTPIEPGWEGYLTLEIYNLNSNPVRLHPGIGITQINFVESDFCEKDYSSSGKYQHQPNKPVLPILSY